jgi:hypothetical protein
VALYLHLPYVFMAWCLIKHRDFNLPEENSAKCGWSRKIVQWWLHNVILLQLVKFARFWAFMELKIRVEGFWVFDAV